MPSRTQWSAHALYAAARRVGAAVGSCCGDGSNRVSAAPVGRCQCTVSMTAMAAGINQMVLANKTSRSNTPSVWRGRSMVGTTNSISGATANAVHRSGLSSHPVGSDCAVSSSSRDGQVSQQEGGERLRSSAGRPDRVRRRPSKLVGNEHHSDAGHWDEQQNVAGEKPR